MKPKVSIIGCGNVGTRYAYALTIKGLARQIVLVDIDQERLEGEVMDLSHGAPYTPPVKIKAGKYEDVKNSDLIVITAGKNQEPGESRLDLIDKNVKLFKDIIPKIKKFAPNSVYLVVSNPVDILSYATYKISGKPENEVIGSGTTLDTSRFRYLLGKKCNMNAKNIHAYILGEHGDSEFAVWSRALVGGMFFTDYFLTCHEIQEQESEDLFRDIFQQVKHSAYTIIDKKGETSYGIGLALARISQAILNDENTILPVSTLIKGYLGVDDIYLSLPAVLNREGVSRVLEIELNQEEKQKFQESAEKLKKTIENVKL